MPIRRDPFRALERDSDVFVCNGEQRRGEGRENEDGEAEGECEMFDEAAAHRMYDGQLAALENVAATQRCVQEGLAEQIRSISVAYDSCVAELEQVRAARAHEDDAQAALAEERDALRTELENERTRAGRLEQELVRVLDYALALKAENIRQRRAALELIRERRRLFQRWRDERERRAVLEAIVKELAADQDEPDASVQNSSERSAVSNPMLQKTAANQNSNLNPQVSPTAGITQPTNTAVLQAGSGSATTGSDASLVTNERRRREVDATVTQIQRELDALKLPAAQNATTSSSSPSPSVIRVQTVVAVPVSVSTRNNNTNSTSASLAGPPQPSAPGVSPQPQSAAARPSQPSSVVRYAPDTTPQRGVLNVSVTSGNGAVNQTGAVHSPPLTNQSGPRTVLTTQSGLSVTVEKRASQAIDNNTSNGSPHRLSASGLPAVTQQTPPPTSTVTLANSVSLVSSAATVNVVNTPPVAAQPVSTSAPQTQVHAVLNSTTSRNTPPPVGPKQTSTVTNSVSPANMNAARLPVGNAAQQSRIPNANPQNSPTAVSANSTHHVTPKLVGATYATTAAVTPVMTSVATALSNRPLATLAASSSGFARTSPQRASVNGMTSLTGTQQPSATATVICGGSASTFQSSMPIPVSVPVVPVSPNVSAASAAQKAKAAPVSVNAK